MDLNRRGFGQAAQTRAGAAIDRITGPAEADSHGVVDPVDDLDQFFAGKAVTEAITSAAYRATHCLGQFRGGDAQYQIFVITIVLGTGVDARRVFKGSVGRHSRRTDGVVSRTEVSVLQVEAAVTPSPDQHKRHGVGSGTSGITGIGIGAGTHRGIWRCGRRKWRIDDVRERGTKRVATGRNLSQRQRIVNVVGERLAPAVGSSHTKQIQRISGIAAAGHLVASGIDAGRPFVDSYVAQQGIPGGLQIRRILLTHIVIVNYLEHRQQRRRKDADHNQHQRELDNGKTDAVTESVDHQTPPTLLIML
jgi:hypothetical protein